MRDLEFHGDLLFCGNVPGKLLGYFAARFTDGQLMWIRPLSEFSERHRTLLLHAD